jgi:2-succinyl-5-enolpyruvyl-6-hydroxy-3-cyclohexene-1-carboxylate synthase
VPEDGDWVEPLDGRDGGAPWTARVAAVRGPVADDLPARTVIVIGQCTGDLASAALRLAAGRGFPVVAEPSSSADAPQVVTAAELVLATPGWLEAHAPDRVLVVGRPTLSRVVARLVGVAPADVVGAHGQWSDPARQAQRVLPGVPEPGGPVAPDWMSSWLDAGRAARAAIDQVLAEAGLSEPVVAAEVVAAAGELLVVGSSKPVRDLFLAGGREGLRVLANRGAAGIDGTVSTAVGAALAHGRPTLALLGDLTFLHDANGLVLGPEEPRPDLTIVVVNNDGGAIFGLLEQGTSEHADAFERVFGTPHGVDLQALCAATQTPYVLATTREELRAALRDGGLRVVEVRTDRTAAVALDRELRAGVSSTLVR